MYMAVPWVTPIKDDAIRCEATTFVMDERWGGWTNRCQLRKGHGGYHRHPLDACDPKAFMAWVGTRNDGLIAAPSDQTLAPASDADAEAPHEFDGTSEGNHP